MKEIKAWYPKVEGGYDGWTSIYKCFADADPKSTLV